MDRAVSEFWLQTDVELKPNVYEGADHTMTDNSGLYIADATLKKQERRWLIFNASLSASFESS